jgi:hypothetical protein
MPPSIGHIKVKVYRGAYHVEEHIGENKYKKIETLYKFADTLKYRNLTKITHNGKLQARDFEPPTGRKKRVCKKPKVVKVKRPKPQPIPKTPAPRKVVQTMEATLKAKDKALEKIETKDGIVIAEENRPQKVDVIIDSKTTMKVYPHTLEHAKDRYRQRYKQSQEQSHNHQRKPIPKAKEKQQQSEQYFYN